MSPAGGSVQAAFSRLAAMVATGYEAIRSSRKSPPHKRFEPFPDMTDTSRRQILGAAALGAGALATGTLAWSGAIAQPNPAQPKAPARPPAPQAPKFGFVGFVSPFGFGLG